jgi:mono/diheme cytochrome c family protein
MARASLVFLCLFTLAGSAAPRQGAQAPASYPAATAPAALAGAVERGDAVITAIRHALMGELTKEMRRGGPSVAIKTCHLEATAMAQQVARKHGVAAGRTSHRLRNPTNAPKAWAAPIVASHEGKPMAGVDGFVVDLGDRVGLLRPIGFSAACAGCHGPREGLAPDILKELQERYPSDQAVGFTEGDIRGWFWVEIPKG